VREGRAKDLGGRRLARRRETIVHPAAVAPRLDDARPAQVRQMARDFRLADPQDSDEVADAHFAVGDQIQEAETRGIGERAKEIVERAAVGLRGHGPSITHLP